jgi:hypothetical protein
VRTLTWSEYLAEAGTARAALFRHWSLPDWSEEEERFADAVAGRTILAPTYPMLGEDELAALRHAAAAVGEDRAYGSSVERITSSSDGGIPLQDVEFSLEAPEPPEEIAYLRHVVHSPSGRWGLVVSLDYTLAGGDARFMEALVYAWPTLNIRFPKLPRPPEIWGARDQALHVVREVRERRAAPEPAPRWLVDLLEHVYGQDEARELMDRGWT